VVATGLGSEMARAPLQVVVENHQPVEVDQVPNYKDLDQPAIRRKRAEAGGRAAVAVPAEGGEEYFDIPAFLRRQAD